jgi:hypothetical protein
MAADACSDYYQANERNGGPLQALWEKSIEKLTELSAGYTDSGPRLIRIINSGHGANMLMIPTSTADIVQFIAHISVATRKHLLGGTEILMFAHGNLSESPFKTLGVVATVSSMYPANLV